MGDVMSLGTNTTDVTEAVGAAEVATSVVAGSPKLFRLHMRANSKFRGRVASNTFFGVYCVAYKLVYGEDKLREFLQSLVNNPNAEMSFSNMLETETYKLANTSNITYASKCLIERSSGIRVNVMDSQEFFVAEFDVLMYTSLTLDKIKRLSKVVEILGIGANRSTGSGNVTIVSITLEDQDKIPMNNEHAVLLSNIVPADGEDIKGELSKITRNGITYTGKKQKSLIQIEAGSVITRNEGDQSKLMYGQVVYDEQSDTYINCRGMAV